MMEAEGTWLLLSSFFGVGGLTRGRRRSIRIFLSRVVMGERSGESWEYFRFFMP